MILCGWWWSARLSWGWSTIVSALLDLFGETATAISGTGGATIDFVAKKSEETGNASSATSTVETSGGVSLVVVIVVLLLW
jgi:hypothetical protein